MSVEELIYRANGKIGPRTHILSTQNAKDSDTRRVYRSSLEAMLNHVYNIHIYTSTAIQFYHLFNQ